MEQQNSRIADIYQRMLMGDKSALSSLQSVKITTKNSFHHLDEQKSETYNKLKQQYDTKSYGRNQQQYLSQQGMVSGYDKIKNSPKKIQTIHQELFQQSFDPNIIEKYNKMQQKQQQNQEKQNFSSFIKNKVNQLRNQKQFIKSQQEKEISEIKKITKDIKLSMANQSKSYDLVRKKQTLPNQLTDQSQTTKNKKRFESLNVKENLKKAQSQVQYGTNKHLPPLNQRKKVPTQNSQRNSQLADSNYQERSTIGTPISLANQNYKSPSMKEKGDLASRNGQVSMKDIKPKDREKLKLKDNKKVRQSRAVRVPLPELKKQREQFAFINQRQKSMQLDLIQFHQQTKSIIQNVKISHNINLKNESKFANFKRLMDPQPILTSNNHNGKSHNSQENPAIQNENQSIKRKRHFDILQEKIIEQKKDIELIEQLIGNKKTVMNNLQQKTSKNGLVKYWSLHDLYTSNFQNQQQQENYDSKGGYEFQDKSSMTSSNINQTYYSKAMANTKQKGWKSKAIKQYDTNRLFQQFAKSRSKIKQSKISSKQRSKIILNRIQQRDDDQGRQQEQQRDVYKVTVDSRLKRLLLQ